MRQYHFLLWSNGLKSSMELELGSSHYRATLLQVGSMIWNSPLNHKAPFCTSTFNSKLLIVLLNVHTGEKQHLRFMYTMNANASNNTPSYIHVSSYVVWRIYPPEIIASWNHGILFHSLYVTHTNWFLLWMSCTQCNNIEDWSSTHSTKWMELKLMSCRPLSLN
jgi:hypothetical protein